MDTTKKIRLVLADEQTLFLKGIAMILNSEPYLEVCGTAVDGRELLQLVRNEKPDIILTNIKLPVKDGIEVIRQVHKYASAVKVIAVADYNRLEEITEAVKAGAAGFIMKTSDLAEIPAAIKSLAAGIPYCCHFTSSALMKQLQEEQDTMADTPGNVQFNAIEKNIIRLICKDYNSREMAMELHVSSHTVDLYRRKILEKMKVKTGSGVAIYAVKHGLFKPEIKAVLYGLILLGEEWFWSCLTDSFFCFT